MLATLVEEPFDRPEWIYEEKYDGVRILAYKEGERASLLTRNAIDRTDRYREVARAVAKLNSKALLLDGEVVVFDKKKVSRFQMLQQRQGIMKYVVFDCLYHDGTDLRKRPLRERREILEKVIRRGPDETILLSEKLAENGIEAFAVARKRKLEGLVAKNTASKYQERRSHEWLKVKLNHESEFVIGGYTKPAGSRQYFGALLLGVYEGKKLCFAGKVGTGFDARTLRELSNQLQKIKVTKSPFDDEVDERDATFVRPKLVAQIAYTEWTGDGRLRHPAYLGLREDKSAREVRREEV
ncbi:MAG: non-homologous end-joining DNA ligase [Candidatus Acidiferrum sp.]